MDIMASSIYSSYRPNNVEQKRQGELIVQLSSVHSHDTGEEGLLVACEDTYKHSINYKLLTHYNIREGYALLFCPAFLFQSQGMVVPPCIQELLWFLYLPHILNQLLMMSQ